MKQLTVWMMFATLVLTGCDMQWWKPKPQAVPPTEIKLSLNEVWTRVTPHREVAVSGNGTTDDPYVYNVPMALNLNGHNISVMGYQGMGRMGPGVGAVFHVNGGLIGNGNIDVSSQGRSGGRLEITASGGIELNSIATGGWSPSKTGKGGGLVLNAGGPLRVHGYINTAGTTGGSDVTLTGTTVQIGQYNACSLFASGPAQPVRRSLLSMDKPVSRGGHIEINSPGAVILAGGILASGGQPGEILIRNTQGQRAGGVSIGGDIDLSGSTAQRGKLAVTAEGLQVGGNVIGQGHGGPGSEIDIDCAGDCRIRGYVRTDSASSASGHVRIQARHVWVESVEKRGWSIYTYPGSAHGSAAGDGDVVLQGVDSTPYQYDPANPLAGATSSILVAGRIVTGYAGANQRGEVLLEAVEVQLGGDVQIGISNERTLEIHYGTDRYGLTHLVENGVRWDGTSAHHIRYGAAIPNFLPEVPYAGIARR